MEKMEFWNHLEEYFHSLKRTEEGTESWDLHSLKAKKVAQPQPEPVVIPDSIGNALNKETAPIPEV